MFSKSRARTLGCLFALGALVATLATACDPAPTITNVQSNPSTTSAYIYWETNVASSSQVFYGPTSSYGTAAPIDTNGTTTHLYLLTGLAPATTYHYKVQSKTTTSDVGESGDYTFTTFVQPAANCGVTSSTDEACWAAATGVPNTYTADPNDRWTSAQLRNNSSFGGHVPTDQLSTMSGEVILDNANDFSSGAGTQANPYVLENKKLTGCVAVRMDHVVLRNVYFVVQSGQDNGCALVGGNPVCGGCGPSMFDLGQNLADVRIEDSNIDFNENTGNFPEGSFKGGIIGYGLHLTRSNVHGGFITIGYSGNSVIQDSYIHDPTSSDHTCAVTSPPTCGHLHSETLWEQGINNWALRHSFVKHNPNAAQSGGGCLCDNTTHDVALVDSYMNGSTNWGVEFCGTHTKVVWQNLTLSGNAGYALCGGPNGDSDYVSGVWTPSWNSTTGLPVITASKCSNVSGVC